MVSTLAESQISVEQSKTSLNVESVNLSTTSSTRSPCCSRAISASSPSSSALVTSSLQNLQHRPDSINPNTKSHYTQKPQKENHQAEANFKHFGDSCDSCCSSCSCTSYSETESESDGSEGEFFPSLLSPTPVVFPTLPVPLVLRQGQGEGFVNPGTEGPGRSSFLKSKKKEQYRIRFEIKDDQENNNGIPLQPTQGKPLTGTKSSASGVLSSIRPRGSFRGKSATICTTSGCTNTVTGPLAKSSGDSGLTTSSYSSSSRAQSPIPTEIASSSYSHKNPIVEKRQNLLPSRLPSNAKLNISASCNNISARKVDGFPQLPPKEAVSQSSLVINKKPTRTKSLRKLLIKSKSFVFPSRSSSTKVEIRNSFTNRGGLSGSARYPQQKIDCKTKDANTFCKPQPKPTNVSKWLRGFNKRETVNQEPTLLSNPQINKVCKCCGGFTEAIESQDFIPSPRKYATLQAEGRNCGKILPNKNKNGYEQRSWLEMNSEDIYSYGRYTRLPSNEHFAITTDISHKKLDHPDLLSTDTLFQNRSQSVYKNKEQYQGRIGSGKISSGGGSFCISFNEDVDRQHKFNSHNKCEKQNSPTKKLMGLGSVQQVETKNPDKSVTMTNYNTYQPTSMGQYQHSMVEFHLDQDEYKIPRPKLKFVIPTHSYGVVGSKTKGNYGRKVDIVDASGFTEISLSDNEVENEGDDTAYGSGSGSGSSSKSSTNKFRSDHSSEDSTLSEFEREQELSIVNGE